MKCWAPLPELLICWVCEQGLIICFPASCQVIPVLLMGMTHSQKHSLRLFWSPKQVGTLPGKAWSIKAQGGGLLCKLRAGPGFLWTKLVPAQSSSCHPGQKNCLPTWALHSHRLSCDTGFSFHFGMSSPPVSLLKYFSFVKVQLSIWDLLWSHKQSELCRQLTAIVLFLCLCVAGVTSALVIQLVPSVWVSPVQAQAGTPVGQDMEWGLVFPGTWQSVWHRIGTWQIFLERINKSFIPFLLLSHIPCMNDVTERTEFGNNNWNLALHLIVVWP